MSGMMVTGGSWVGNSSGGVPDDGLMFFNSTTSEYFMLTMDGQILTWVQL